MTERNNIIYTMDDEIFRKSCWNSDGQNCAPLLADLFLYFYDRDFMDSLNQADVIEGLSGDR